MPVLEAVRKGEEAAADPLWEIIRWTIHELMEAEVAAQSGAGRYERSSERVIQRNGYRVRPWDTRVGTLELQIPKRRRGSYFPSWLEPRRRAEQARAALEAAETAAVAALEQAGTLPSAPAERLQVGVAGAMVPLVHNAWAEVKTLAIGTVGTREARQGPTPDTTALSYFSRLADATTFRRLAWVETQRRGVPAALDVCGVVDGADWCQHFLDWHCPAAGRILDFPHAAEYVSAAGRSVFGAVTPALTAWLDQQLTALKHGDPAVVLAALEALPAVTVSGPDGPHCPRDTTLGYLTKRRAQIT